MSWKDQIEYYKSYFRVMPADKFKYIVSNVATITGMCVVYFSTNLYFILCVISLIISTVMYFKRK